MTDDDAQDGLVLSIHRFWEGDVEGTSSPELSVMQPYNGSLSDVSKLPRARACVPKQRKKPGHH